MLTIRSVTQTVQTITHRITNGYKGTFVQIYSVQSIINEKCEFVYNGRFRVGCGHILVGCIHNAPGQ